MTELVELYKKLEQYSHFEEDEENCERFLDTVDQIVLKNDPSAIPELLKYCEKNYNYDVIEESLNNVLLYLINKHGSYYFIISLNKLLVKNLCFCEEITSIIFNSKRTYDDFRKNMHLADKESLLKLFKIME
jgi:hypothetical protein